MEKQRFMYEIETREEEELEEKTLNKEPKKVDEEE